MPENTPTAPAQTAPVAQPASTLPPAPATTPDAAAPPGDKPADSHAQDPLWSTLLQGLGIAVGTPETPPAAPTPPPAPSDTVGVSLGTRAFERDQTQTLAPAATPAPDPAAAPPEPAPAAADSQPPAPFPEPEVEVTRRPPIQDVVTDAVRQALADRDRQANETSPAAPATPAPADPFEASLGEAEREELDFFRYAAAKDPKFKDLPGRFIDFQKKLDAYMKKKIGDDPEHVFDEEDADFRKFVRANRPSLAPSERRKIERQQITEQVKTDVNNDFQQRLAAVQRETHVLKVKPVVDNVVSQFVSGLDEAIEKDDTSLARDVISTARKLGWKKAVEADPLFAPIVQNIHQGGTKLAAEYAALVAQAKQFDANNPDHVWLLTFVRNSGEHFAKNGGNARIRDGKNFLPAREYADAVKRDPSTADTHWTFTDRDVFERIGANTKMNIDAQLKSQQERLEKAGFVRQKPAATAQAQTELPKPPTTPPATASLSAPAAAPAPHVSPKATSSISPGAAQTTPPVTQRLMDESTMRALGIPVQT